MSKNYLINESFWKYKDIVLLIFDFISTFHLLELNMVCKQWKKILDENPYFWKKRILEEYPNLEIIYDKAQFSWRNWIYRKFDDTIERSK